MSAAYPNSIATFPTYANLDLITPTVANQPDGEIVAVETGLLNGFAHDLKSDATANNRSLGVTGNAFYNLLLSNNATIGGTIGVTGNATLSGTANNVGTITAGAWHSSTLIGLAYGGTNTDLHTIGKGDLIVGTAAGTVGLKGVGSDGFVLTADAASAGGMKWATALGQIKPFFQANGTFTTNANVTFSTYAFGAGQLGVHDTILIVATLRSNGAADVQNVSLYDNTDGQVLDGPQTMPTGMNQSIFWWLRRDPSGNSAVFPLTTNGFNVSGVSSVALMAGWTNAWTIGLRGGCLSTASLDYDWAMYKFSGVI